MYDTKHIAGIANNVIAAQPFNSKQWLAGEVADIIAMRPEHADERQQVWQAVYDTVMLLVG